MKFSGSKSALLSKCRYSFRDDVTWKEWPKTPEQALGNALHDASDTAVKLRLLDMPVKDEVLLDNVAKTHHVEDREKLNRYWAHMRKYLDGFTWNTEARSSEVKLAVDLGKQSARELHESGLRDYSGALEHEVPLTLDLVGFRNGKRPILLDWKTGQHVHGYWPQIATQAVAVAWRLKTDCADIWDRYQSIEAGILHVTEAGVEEITRVFTSDDLDAIADDLSLWIFEIPDSVPTPGEHCTEMRCGAFMTCPATKPLIRQACSKSIPRWS